MDEIREVILPGSSFNAGTSIFTIIIAVLVVIQVIANVWRWKSTAKQEKQAVENYKKELQASEKRIRDMFTALEGNRRSILENLDSFSSTLNTIKEANATENKNAEALIERAEALVKKPKLDTKNSKKRNE